MGVSENEGTQYRPQDTMILILRTLKKGPQFLETPIQAEQRQHCMADPEPGGVLRTRYMARERERERD